MFELMLNHPAVVVTIVVGIAVAAFLIVIVGAFVLTETPVEVLDPPHGWPDPQTEPSNVLLMPEPRRAAAPAPFYDQDVNA